MSSFRKPKGDKYASAYMMDDQLAGDRRKLRIDRIEQQIVADHVSQLSPGGTVLDVPSGNGRMTQLIDRADLNVVAMDFAHEMLKAMELRKIEGGRGRGRVQGDVILLPLPDKSVDLVVNMRLMHHIADPAMQVRMYRQLARVTRGVVITTFWTTHCWRYLRKRLLGKKVRGHPVSPDHFMSVCRQAGLVVDRIIYTRRWYEDECVAICHPGQDTAAAC